MGDDREYGREDGHYDAVHGRKPNFDLHTPDLGEYEVAYRDAYLRGCAEPRVPVATV